MFRIERRDRLASDASQNDNALLATRRALVTGRLMIGYGWCLGLAIWITTSCALRLRQCIVNALREGPHFRRAVAFLATTAFLAGVAGAATEPSCLLLAKIKSRTSG